MHVLLLIDSLGSGGAQRQLVELAARLARRDDVSVSVLVYHPDDFFEARLEEAGVPLVRLTKHLPVDPTLPLRIRSWLREHPVDVVHAYLLLPSLFSLLAVRSLPTASRPVFLAAERSNLVENVPLARHLYRFVYGRSDAVTVNSQAMLRALPERVGVPGDRVHFLPNGIDLERWDEACSDACPLPLEPGCLQLALVGGFRGPEKGHLVLFEALERLGIERIRGWRIWCVGARIYGRAEERQIDEAVARRGLREVVRLEAPVDNVAALMSRLDAVLLPSLFEGFPNVVLEAMASRLPVVASPVGEVPSLVEDGVTGFLAATGDAAALAGALDRLASLSPEDRRAMGQRGRARVEARYEIGRVAEQHVALYGEILRERRADVDR